LTYNKTAGPHHNRTDYGRRQDLLAAGIVSDEIPSDEIERMFAARERGEPALEHPVEYKAPAAAWQSAAPLGGRNPAATWRGSAPLEERNHIAVETLDDDFRRSWPGVQHPHRASGIKRLEPLAARSKWCVDRVDPLESDAADLADELGLGWDHIPVPFVRPQQRAHDHVDRPPTTAELQAQLKAIMARIESVDAEIEDMTVAFDAVADKAAASMADLREAARAMRKLLRASE
jgi:uncharacterized protein (UPF0335 family)